MLSNTNVFIPVEVTWERGQDRTGGSLIHFQSVLVHRPRDGSWSQHANILETSPLNEESDNHLPM